MRNATPASLANAIQVGTTAGDHTIAGYNTEIGLLANYGLVNTQGQSVTCTIPLYASQVVAATDAGGSYSITLTYVATPGY
jgi:hypothetical protein